MSYLDLDGMGFFFFFHSFVVWVKFRVGERAQSVSEFRLSFVFISLFSCMFCFVVLFYFLFVVIESTRSGY